jgi:hypothetical protein
LVDATALPAIEQAIFVAAGESDEYARLIAEHLVSAEPPRVVPRNHTHRDLHRLLTGPVQAPHHGGHIFTAT